jgi:DNA-binding MarR family transcriptional regulator
MATPLTHLDEAELHVLAADLRVLLGRLRKRLRQQANLGDFSFNQLQVVLRLEREGPATVSALAKAEGMRPQSMSETVAVLKAAGLLTGSPDPADGRQTLISLTPACKQALRANRSAREDWLFHALRQKLSAAEHARLAAACGLLQRLLEP